MKEAFKPGTRVRFRLKDGTLGAHAVISDKLDESGSKIPGYAGEGLYFITTIFDQRQLIASHDDLVFSCATCKGTGEMPSGYCMCGAGGNGQCCDNHNFVSMEERCGDCDGRGVQ